MPSNAPLQPTTTSLPAAPNARLDTRLGLSHVDPPTDTVALIVPLMQGSSPSQSGWPGGLSWTSPGSLKEGPGRARSITALTVAVLLVPCGAGKLVVRDLELDPGDRRSSGYGGVGCLPAAKDDGATSADEESAEDWVRLPASWGPPAKAVLPSIGVDAAVNGGATTTAPGKVVGAVTLDIGTWVVSEVPAVQGADLGGGPCGCHRPGRNGASGRGGGATDPRLRGVEPDDGDAETIGVRLGTELHLSQLSHADRTCAAENELDAVGGLPAYTVGWGASGTVRGDRRCGVPVVRTLGDSTYDPEWIRRRADRPRARVG